MLRTSSQRFSSLKNKLCRVRIGCLAALTIWVATCLLPDAQLIGQGVLLPQDQNEMRLPRIHWGSGQSADQSYRIKSLEINSRIENQIAVTQISQTFVNTGRRQIQASFVFPLPYDGAVDSMTFLVNGKEHEAKLLPAEKARQIYEGYMRRNQDPALLEWVGRGMFKTSVFPIPPGAERTVQINYTQLLRQDSGVNDYLIPLSTAKYTSAPIQKFSVRAAITTTQKLKSIYSPTHDGIQIDRSGDSAAVVKLEKVNFIPGNDFRVLFAEDNKSIGARLLSHWQDVDEHGYFTLLVNPDIPKSSQKPARKTVLFVIDRSGSMNGAKISQARDAAKFVLNNLRQNDLFNIVTYSNEVESFQPELQSFNSETRTAALGYLDGVYSGGGTNINQALTTTLNMIGKDPGPTYVIFLTDGLPTQGETRELKIAENTRQNNQQGARLISFGVGFDVNSRLLDRLTRENNGQSQYVRPDEDLEEHVSNLYEKISAPVLTDVEINYEIAGKKNGEAVSRIYPADTLDLFANQQLVLVGRYRQSGSGKLEIKGKIDGQERTFEYDFTFADKGSVSRYGFCARLWAARRIGEIIDLVDLQGQNQELVQELVALSTKHGIVTPYTSYLADDLARANDLADNKTNVGRSTIRLGSLQESGGAGGFAQRGFKQRLKRSASGQSPASDSFGMGGGAGGGGGAGLGRRRASANGGRSGGGGGAAGPGNFGNSSVRNAGKYTVYLKGNVLIASNATDIDPEKDLEQITVIERFSTEYFDLTKANNADENQLLALQLPNEQLIVRLRGKVYRIK